MILDRFERSGGRKGVDVSYKLFLLSFLAFLSSGLAEAGVFRILSDPPFSQHAVRLRIGTQGEELVPDGADPSRIFQRWGVTFSTGHRSQLQILPPPIPLFGPPPPVIPTSQRLVVRQRESGSEADDPLSVEFARPMKGVLFQLPFGGGTGEATAFDPAGNRLGAIVFDPHNGSLVGMLTNDPGGIARVILDFEVGGEGEILEGLSFDPLEPLGFSLIVPQLGVGAEGALDFSTSLSLVNLSNSTATGSVVFRASDGGPFFNSPLLGNQLDFRIAPFGAERIRLDTASIGPITGIATGYASIEATQPIDATVVFTTSNSALGRVFSAGIQATPVGLVHLVEVQRSGQHDTGIAIANPGLEAVTVEMRVYRGNEPVESGSMTLEAGHHMAFFLDQVFEGLREVADLEATVLIQSRFPLAVTALLTRQGRAVASVPVSRLP